MQPSYQNPYMNSRAEQTTKIGQNFVLLGNTHARNMTKMFFLNSEK